MTLTLIRKTDKPDAKEPTFDELVSYILSQYAEINAQL